MTDVNQLTMLDEERKLTGEEKDEAVEAILFAAGYPVKYEKLASVFDTDAEEIKEYIAEFSKRYNEGKTSRGIRLLTLDDSCQLCTKEKYVDYIRQALGIIQSGKLSNSSIEVLAIIAYNQPVTKAYIEQVRGVDCSYAISSLCDKFLIEPKGRLDAPGRPILYGTTPDFLRCFGLDSLDKLPTLTDEVKK